jgi:SAM-dependent methyltransferase
LIEYGSMLLDQARVDAYTRALTAVISPSSVVLDLGTGIGTFSVLACKLGAARVYAVDSGDVITVAEEVAKRNGVASRIRFLQIPATELELPEKVDVIVSDLSGSLPLFEGHIPAVIHVRERFLRAGGVLIPARDRLMCAPLSSVEIYARIVDPWRSVAGIDFLPAATMALNTPHGLVVQPQQLAAAPVCWAELDYATIASANVSASIEWQIVSTNEIHGFALWFESTMQGDVVVSSGPWFPRSVHSTMVLPLLEPLHMRENESLGLRLEATLASGRYVVTWQARTDQQTGLRQSTFLAEPRSTQSFLTRKSEPASGIATLPERAAFRRLDHVLARRVGRELLLLDPAPGIYHVLNETGARVWESLERGAGVESIAAAVASDYDVDARRAADDVAAVLAELLEANLIEYSRPDP